MNKGTKQRIVGSLVLIAVALIFLPVFFDGEGSYTPTVSSRIPPPPVIEPMPEPVQERPVFTPPPAATVPAEGEPVAVADTATDTPGVTAVTEPDTTAADTSAQLSDKPADATDSAPQLDASGLPVGWSVRLGSFSNAANASNLLQRLLDAGYKAYSREVNADQGVLTVVYVGPLIERAAVEELRGRLRDQYQLNGMVVRFEVEQFQ